MDNEIPTTLIYWGISGAVVLIVAVQALFVVRQKTAALVERLGKFHAVRTSGLNFKVPFIDKIVCSQSLRIQQLDVDVETKTLDNVFVNSKVSIQFRIN